MSELYFTNTRRKVDPSTVDNIDQGVLDGSLGYKKGTRVNVVKDGEVYNFPSENIQQALMRGYTIERPFDADVRKYVDKNKGLSGAVKVGLGQFADEFGLGLPEIILDKTGDPLEVAKKEALKKEHQLVNDIAGVAGFGASAFIPVVGPVNLLAKGAAKAGAVATALGSKALASQAGKSAARKVGSDIAAKAAGGSIEGLLSVAPQAITEAALGDTELAAETALMGGTFGGLLGPVFGSAVPKSTSGLSKVNKAAADALTNEDAARRGVAKAGSEATGVPMQDIEYLMHGDNMERMTGKTFQGMTDDVVSQLEVIQAAKKADLDRKKIDAEWNADENALFADDFFNALEAQKDIVSGESAFAVDMLDQVDQMIIDAAAAGEDLGVDFVKRDGILRSLNSRLDNLAVEGVEIGDKTKAAANAIRKRIDEIAELPEEIPYTSLKRVIQRIEKDIDYSRIPGQFNDDLNSAMKGVRRYIDDQIKDNTDKILLGPGGNTYRQAMGNISERMGALNRASKAFATKDRVKLSALKGVLDPKNVQNKAILQEFDAVTGNDFLGRLEFKKNAQDGYERAKEEFKTLGAATPEKATRKIAQIRQMAQGEGMKKFTAALKQIDDEQGTTLLQEATDASVLRNFATSKPNGSRRVLMGALIDLALGGSGAMGGYAGYAIDFKGGKMLRTLLEAGYKRKDGLLWVEQQMKRASQKMSEMSEAIEKTGRPDSKASRTARQAIYRTFGVDDEKSRQRRFEKLSGKFEEFAANPMRAVELLTGETDGISITGAPETAGVMAEKIGEAVIWLAGEYPKLPSDDNPFRPRVKWTPPDSAIRAWEDKAIIVENPMMSIDLLKSGTLNRNHVEALQQVYPAILQRMQKEIITIASQGPKPVSYNKRMKLSLLLGAPLDNSLADVAYYQSTYQAPDVQEEEQAQASDQVKASGITEGTKRRMTAGISTGSQRVEESLG